MPGIGQTPPDYTAPIGQFRLLAQDTNSVALVPMQTGLGTYDLFSDEEIAGYLSIFNGYSIYRAVGAGYQGMAARAGMQAKMVKDYDLQIDLTKQAAALQSVAEMYYQRATAEELLTGVSSAFILTNPAYDWQEDWNFEAPFKWGVSPLEYVMGGGPFGGQTAGDIADLGGGSGITITNGSATP